VSAAPPSSLPKYLMFGGAAAVLIAAIVVGARFVTNRTTESPTVISEPAPPPPVQPSPVQRPPVQPSPSAQAGVQTAPANTAGPRTNSGLVTPNANAGLGTRPGETIPPPKVEPPPLDPPVRPEPPRPTTTVQPTVTPGGSARDRNLADVYGRAKAALDSGAFGTAASLFETLQRDEPGYRDAADLLARAKEGIAAAVKQTMDAAAKLESSGDLPEALRQLERVAQIDPSMAIVAEQAMNRVRTRMRTEGTQAFTNAKQFDALERVDQAITWYERAFRLLPDDNPNKKIAKERLDLLRARR
jgi:tetratricopeptide (TPR) repeat protein